MWENNFPWDFYASCKSLCSRFSRILGSKTALGNRGRVYFRAEDRFISWQRYQDKKGNIFLEGKSSELLLICPHRVSLFLSELEIPQMRFRRSVCAKIHLNALWETFLWELGNKAEGCRYDGRLPAVMWTMNSFFLTQSSLVFCQYLCSCNRLISLLISRVKFHSLHNSWHFLFAFVSVEKQRLMERWCLAEVMS